MGVASILSTIPPIEDYRQILWTAEFSENLTIEQTQGAVRRGESLGQMGCLRDFPNAKQGIAKVGFLDKGGL